MYILKIIRILILVCALVPFANATIIEDDIIMYYDFNDDSIINGNITDKVSHWDGIIQKNITTGQAGLLGDSFKFNGGFSGDDSQQAFINISGNPLLSSTQGSFYVWFKKGNLDFVSEPTWEDTSYWQYFMVNQKGYDYTIAGHDGDFSCAEFWEFFFWNDVAPNYQEKLNFQTYYSTTQCGTKTFQVNRMYKNSEVTNYWSDEEWHLWVVTWSGTTITQYLDGVTDTIYNNNNFQFHEYNDSNTYIGTFYTNEFNAFNGYVDELALFNRALTPTEVSFAYNGGLGKTRTQLLGIFEENTYYAKIKINAEDNSINVNLLKSGYNYSTTSNIINWLNIVWGGI